jgi:hypothetical protein
VSYRGKQKSAFQAARKAAVAKGWKPFTKMNKKQRQAFNDVLHFGDQTVLDKAKKEDLELYRYEKRQHLRNL